jgi:hypothetical protein
MSKEYPIINREKFFYVSPNTFKDWKYPSRMGIGMKLSDFWGKESPVFRFRIKGKVYEIESSKAIMLGKKFTLKAGALPNIIPVSEFIVIDEEKDKPKEDHLGTLSLF